MSLTIKTLLKTPKNEVVFKGPFNDGAVSKIYLTNPANKLMCYKIEASAPKQYCVLPTCDFIEPNDTKEVNIIMQPMDAKRLKEAVNHEFILQACFVPNDCNNPEEIWRNKDSLNLAHTKLTVKFEEEEMLDDGQSIYNLHENSMGSGIEQSINQFAAGDAMNSLCQEVKFLNNEIRALHMRNNRLENEIDPIVYVIFATIVGIIFGLIIGRSI